MDFFFFSEMFKLDLKILVILSRSNHLNFNFLSKGSLVICFFFPAWWHFAHSVMLFKWLEFVVK